MILTTTCSALSTDNRATFRIAALLGASLTMGALFTGCAKQDEGESQPSVKVEVRVSRLRSGSIDDIVDASGTTANLRESQLRSPVNGVIAKLRYFNGDTVQQGEAIAVILTRESQASIQGAEKLLHDASTDIQRDEAAKALRIAQEGANSAVVKAPYTGILSNKQKNESEAIGEGESFASLIDPRSIVFIADVPSSSLGRVKPREEARIRFPSLPNKVFFGTVSRIDPQVNPNDQTAHVQIDFTLPAVNLDRSLFGDAAIIVGRKSGVLLAPTSSLLHNDEDNTTAVVVVENDSVAHRMNVAVGSRQDSLVQIISNGLKPGDRVIVQGHYGLPDSTRVRVVQ